MTESWTAHGNPVAQEADGNPGPDYGSVAAVTLYRGNHGFRPRAQDGSDRVDPAAGAVGAMGRVVLLRQVGGGRAAALHHRAGAGGIGGTGAQPARARQGPA